MALTFHSRPPSTRDPFHPVAELCAQFGTGAVSGDNSVDDEIPVDVAHLDYLAGFPVEDVGHAVVWAGGISERLRANLEQAHLTRLYDGCCDFLPAHVLLETGGYPDVFAY